LSADYTNLRALDVRGHDLSAIASITSNRHLEKEAMGFSVCMLIAKFLSRGRDGSPGEMPKSDAACAKKRVPVQRLAVVMDDKRPHKLG